MSFFDNLWGGIRNSFDKKRENRESMESMQREIDFQKRQVFEEEYRKNALEVAKSQAKKEAAELSGIRKLRALNRVRNLEKQNDAPPGNFFEKLSDYTRKNKARREENLEKTRIMREAAAEERLKKPGDRKNIKPQWH